MRESHNAARRNAMRTIAIAPVLALDIANHRVLAGPTPVRLILPVAPASSVDIGARAVQPELARALGSPVVIENVPGAGGLLGTLALIKAAPDGTTLALVSVNLVIFPNLYKAVPFDPVRDVTPIAIIGAAPLVIVGNPKLPAKNARELVALMKERPGKLNFGSSGNGTQLHLGGALFLKEVGAKANHIPYKGVGPMISDLIGGQIDWCVSALPSVQQYIADGTLRGIGVASLNRAPTAPDLPTFAEQGIPNFQIEGWSAMIAPKGLPPAQADRIHSAIVQAYGTPAVKETMSKLGSIIRVSSREEAVRFLSSEQRRYSELVKEAGLQLG
ncbi:tripartite tricarboxylate transporter substrate binding protein (plasmid) [Cupriavidus oxalaticus]|uniref:Tripartite tricarboxylate transporter substrate binding protein n=2 Tax=Cupriavidus oxalaticus TaxID=96344 RepID=A0A4P7LKW1_9BURK|nr:tripartite tricarboxylate transporter substrate binding protein [Cupriavidus oxalaticus]